MNLLKSVRKVFGQRKNRKFKDITLEFAFLSSDGSKMYIWNDKKALPLERLSEMLKIQEFISSGVDGETLELYLNEAELLISKGLSDPKVAAQLAALFQTLKMRKTAFPHKDLLLNYAAIWLIREDEDPFKYDELIHKEKVRAFEKDCREMGSYFFFAMTGLGYISRWLSVSELQLNQLLIQAEESRHQMQEMLNFIRTLSVKPLATN
jgi:hypothetical protein